ncbi:MAG TPA: LysM domain-containing protein [Aggregatilineales bacterium]|nr:LysM domain-containing protein [Aggregatilineales bacterium]
MTAQLYLIQEGDTLSGIAQNVCGDASLVEAIAAYNHIDNPDFIIAGTNLIIDCDALRTWTPGTPPPIPGPNPDGTYG